MPSRTATARSSAPSSSPKRTYKGSYRNGASPSGQRRRRGPTKSHSREFSKKVPKAKSGKPFHHKRQNHNVHPKHNMLLHRLSPPSSSSPGTLLERIGGSIEDEAASTLTHSDRIDEERVLEAVDICSDSMSFSTTPHFYTPDPGEVEQFLESVIDALPAPPSPSGSGHVRSLARIKDKPALALETHNLIVNHLVEDPSSPVLYSPTQTVVNSLSSANLTLDHNRDSLLGDTMAPPSTSTVEECRKRLVPVLLASAQVKDAGKRLDSEQCLRLLSDDHCRNFFRKAKEMRLQLSSLVSQKTPVNRSWSGSMKRDRVDEVDAWVRNTRNRFNSTNTVISDVSRKDSDITLVDFTGGKLLPPRAPRAMLQTSQAVLGKLPDNAREEAPYEALVTSPKDYSTSATSLIELVHQAMSMFPTLVTTSQPESEPVDISNVSTGHLTGERSGHPNQVPSLTHSATSPSSVDFISHSPTQPGIWFKLQGRRYAEIIDVDVEVSDEIFYMSGERQPFRLRTHLRLCSVPVGAVMKNNNGDTPASFQDVHNVVEHHAAHWPKKGKLVVQVNPESERSKTWLPHVLESDPLDVTSCVRPGKNTFRFIQLSDLSEYNFVLVASPPPPEEEWRSWDWESLVERSRTRSTDDDMNGLSEFARLPIIVRS